MKWLYLSLDAFTLLGPFLLSFDKKVAFYTYWKPLFWAVLIMMAVFIPWDMAFTDVGVWNFNPAYLSGINIGNLPIEECLFFVVVPYACTFIYACLNAYISKDLLLKIHRPFLLMLAVCLLLVAFINYQKLYTSITFGVTGLTVLFALWKRYAWLSRFLLAYFVSLIPFLIVNGVLTGTAIEDQVVGYNPEHILNIRIGTIPIEDSIYNLLMLLMTIGGMELLRPKQLIQRQITD